MIAVRLATYAMRTRFEVVLVGEEPRFLRSAGEEALGEVEELERLLSRFEEDSDIGRINRMAAFVPVRVDARTFSLLQRAVALSVQTNGAFDVTVGTWWRSEKASGGNVPVGFLASLAGGDDQVCPIGSCRGASGFGWNRKGLRFGACRSPSDASGYRTCLPSRRHQQRLFVGT